MANKFLGRVDGQIRGGQKLIKNQKFFQRQKTFTEQFYVLAENSSKTEDDIIATIGLPLLGAIYSSAYCIGLDAEEVMTVRHPISHVITVLWTVTATYDSQIDGDQAGNADDITDMRPKRKWRSEKEEEVLEKDAVTGAPIVTVAGEPILHKRTVSYIFLEITRYETYPFDPDITNTFVNRLNQDSFYGVPTGCALMDEIESEEEVVNGSVFCKVRYVIKFKVRDDPDNPGSFMSDTFKFRPLHNGYLHFPNPNPGDPIFIPFPVATIKRDKNGQPKRINLDEFGYPLDPGEDPVYLEFNETTKVDFDALNLEF